MGKNTDLFRINLVASKPKELLLAQFFKGSKGEGKEKVVEALLSYYYSLALTTEAGASLEEIELAAIDSISKLQSQISYLVNYHRLVNRIELSSLSFNPLGYMSMSSDLKATAMAQREKKVPPSNSGDLRSATEDKEDDEGEYEILGQAVYSPELLKTLYGQGK